jgi:hypothetical protein
MVKGLEQFKRHFASHADQYVLIGGTACTVIMEEAGLEFRATKDLDVVLYVEALNTDFVNAFWQFIREGGYQNQQQSTGKKIFYRFYSPSNIEFPAMLELFSRLPDTVNLSNERRLTPIPINDTAVSLSASLLDVDYYTFIHSGKHQIDGLSLLNASHLIPIKARAWIDLSKRKNLGEDVDEKNIRKHKNDILRLYQLLTPAARIVLPEPIKQDMMHFLDHLETDEPDTLKNLRLKTTNYKELLSNLRQIYCID